MELRIEIDEYGKKCYYNAENQIHREDGPAVVWASGTKYWYINGKLHREDGPACEYAYGSKFWYIHGVCLSEEEFNRHTKNPCKCPDYLK